MSSNIDVSIIIPAFNEGRRLPSFLDLIIAHCNAGSLEYEIIVVDDGSADDTSEAALARKAAFPNLEVIKLKKNRGKGCAVKTGMLMSRGKYALFLDADGSVTPDEIENNLKYLMGGDCDVFIGSRAVHNEIQVLIVKWYRKILGEIFSAFVRVFLLRGVYDSQCGFKIFSAVAVRELFSRAYLPGYGFDLEILYLARKMGMTIKEGAVSWRHVDSSKVNLISDSVRMLINVFQIRMFHSRRSPGAQTQLSSRFMDAELERMEKVEQWHWWPVARRKLVTSVLQSWAKKGDGKEMVILDAGCGTGMNIGVLSEYGRVFGIDGSEKSMELCRKKGLVDVFKCRLDELSFSDNSFDVVTCLDVLEHLPDVASALHEVRRVLRPGGALLVTVPAIRFIWSSHDEVLMHMRRYSKKLLRCELEEAGFEVKRIGYLFSLPLIGIGLVRLFKAAIYRRGLHSDLETLPSKLTNKILQLIANLEMNLATKGVLPFGSSLFALAIKEV